MSKLLLPLNSLYIILLFFTYFSISQVTCLSNETDLQTLLAIKIAIVSDQHGALNSWNQTLHFCNWEGISCGKKHRNRVVRINLSSQGLIGSLSPHIGNLSFLKTIILQNNTFSGRIPNEIGRLRRLQAVELSNNSFSGEIPRNLSQCKNLYYLNLIHNDLTGIIIPEIGSLLKLTDLGLGHNLLSGSIPPSIGNLTALEQLHLAACGFVGEIPDSFSQLQSLQLLSLHHNNLTSRIPYGVYNISTMSAFDLSFNQLHGTLPSEIGFVFPKLTLLHLTYNHFTGSIPTSLSNASLLKRIDLDMNNFTGKIMIDFSRLSFLEHFAVPDNNLDGNLDFISSMSNCTSIRVIDVAGNSFNSTLPNSIANLSSQVSLLQLNQNQLHGTIPHGIGNLLGLTVLDIAYNDLEDSIPSEIGKLNNLHQLYLGGNKLVNEIPSSFGNLSLLNDLSLDENNISGSIPLSFSNCTNLLFLSLSHNNLGGSIPREIMSLSSISIRFDLSYNAFTGNIPSEIGSLVHLVNLDLSHNKLSGLIPISLSQCTMLSRINLQSNLFTGQIPNALKSLKSVEYLDLSQNSLSGPIPSFLSEMNLEYLNLSFNLLQGQVPTMGVFQNESGMSLEGNSNLCGGNTFLKLPSCPPNHSKKKQISTLVRILIPFIVAVIFISLLTCFSYIFIYRKRVLRNVKSFAQPTVPEVLRLSYGDLLKATEGFVAENLLGTGRFGSVYKGFIGESQTPVAVKVINLNTKGASKSFMSECAALKGIRHRNLVKIVSVCSSTDFQGNEFKVLVYDFKANGNLDEWLHKNPREDNYSREENRYLSMRQRLSIAADVGCALEYLHCGTDSVIVHGDLKPSNILLDENMIAHVGDFGLAKVFSNIHSVPLSSTTGIKGTIGYIPPEYGTGGIVSTEGDVYSYGILLLEIFTGRRPTDDSFGSDSSLLDFVRSTLPKEVVKVLDPFILHEQNYDMDNKFMQCIISLLGVAVACSAEAPRDRMLMGNVVKELHKIIKAFE